MASAGREIGPKWDPKVEKINPVSFELLMQIDRGATEEPLDVFYLNF